ncbi:MAG: DinB family protein [Chloroflexi bacterium]|nr:DinB family protein [Chloroflexota bacterium]
MTPEATPYLERLNSVETRLRQLSQGKARPGALTTADPPTGEQWEMGQVWAHVAEIIGYWIPQAEYVVHRYAGEPVPFGRVKSNPDRIAAIERDRRVEADVLWQRTQASIASLRKFLENLPEQAWSARGQHQGQGTMSLHRIVDEFLVGHLEQHADQLQSLM